MAATRKSVLITGCSPGGIGHALAREFHAQGLRVFATARKTSTIIDLAELGIETLSLELSDPDSITALGKDVSALTNASLDILINNAGRSYATPLLEVDLTEVQQTFDINVFAVMRMCQAFAPLLIKAKGTIVHIGSLAGFMPFPFTGVYNASKAALHSYNNTLRIEMVQFGVKVVNVVTGVVKSNIARTHPHLPPNSIYLPVSLEYEERLNAGQEDSMPTDVYARSVVTQLLKKTPKSLIWEGNKSWVTWFISNFIPHSVTDTLLTRVFKLWKLSKTGHP